MPDHEPQRDRPRDPRTGADSVAARIHQQSTWVDLQLRQAVARGDFDDLPGFGKPLTRLSSEHDPDWWVKQLIEREQITGVLPPSLLVRKEDGELDRRLDALATEQLVRQAVEEFNARVRWALYRPPEGPPVLTRQRDPEEEVARWKDRRARAAEQRRAGRQPSPAPTGARSARMSGTRPGPTLWKSLRRVTSSVGSRLGWG